MIIEKLDLFKTDKITYTNRNLKLNAKKLQNITSHKKFSNLRKQLQKNLQRIKSS